MTDEGRRVGQIENVPPVTLFLEIVEKSFSGVLILERSDVKKALIFDHSKPISTRSNIRDELLGTMLVEAGRIAQSQLEDAIETQKREPGVLLGHVLIRCGFLDALVLESFLQEQVVRRVHEVLFWKEGRFGLVPGVPDKIVRVPVHSSLPEICFRGLIEKYDRADGADLSGELRPIVSGGGVVTDGQLKLDGKELSLFRAITGVKTIKDILSCVRMPERRAKSIVLSLRDLGIVRLPEPEPEIRKEPARQAPAAKEARTNEAVEESKARFAGIEGKNHFEIMGLPDGASSEDVKRAFLVLAKRFHPDRISKGLSEEDRRVVEQYFAKVTVAHDALSNPDARKEYEERLSLAEQGLDEKRMAEIVQSEVEYQKGLVLLRKNDFDAAAEVFGAAIALYDAEPEYHVNFGWALYRKGARTKDSGLSKRGKASIDKAVKMNPKLVDAHYYLGMIAKTEGDVGRATDCFEQVLRRKPNHPGALAEVRLLRMRSDKEGRRSIASLFKKDD